MTTHHLYYECTLMRLCGGDDSVNSFYDSLQSRIGSNCHVSAAEIIIDRANQTANLDEGTLLGLFLSDSALLYQLLQKIRPFLSEGICTSQRSISSNAYQVCDVTSNEVLACLILEYVFVKYSDNTLSLPAISLNSAHLADPMMVPPC